MDARWKEAIRQGDVKQILDLLEGGSDIDARDCYGQTGLMLAAHAGHCQSVEILIAHGANLDITAKFGLSALMLAVIAGHMEVARVLVNSGADLSLQGTGAPGFTGKTAYDLALERDLLGRCPDLKPEP